MRKNTRKVDIIILTVILLLIAGGILLFMLPGQDSGQTSRDSENTVSASKTAADYNGRPIGILTGSSFESATMEKFPDSKYLYFNTYSDLNIALLDHRIDGYVADEPIMKATHAENSAVSYLSDPVAVDSYCFMFSKSDVKSQTLLKQFNELLSELTADGTLADLQEIWLGEDTGRQVIDRSGLNAENGVITVGTYSGAPPFTMLVSGEFSGLTTDLMYRFARKYGYQLNFEDTDINGMLSGLSAGKYDMLAAPFSKTAEREETADFSEPFYAANNCLAVRTEDIAGNTQSAKSVSISDYAGKTIGVGTGSMFDVLVQNCIPDTKIMYFNSYSDMLVALENGKVDAICLDEPVIKYIIATEDHAVDYIKKPIEEYNYGFSFRKDKEGQALRDQFNAFLQKIKADGTLAEIENSWFGGDQSNHTLPELDSVGAKNGVLKLATEALNMPFSFLEENRITGYEIELAYQFCKECGYGLEISDISFDAIIPAITSGMCDFGCSCMNITDERRESVAFSEPDYVGGAVLAVRAEDFASGGQENASGLKSYEDVRSRPFSYYAENRKIGALTGGLYEIMIRERYPEAEILQFNNQPDMAVALGAGVIDAFTCPESTAKDFMKADPSLTYLNEVFMKIPYGFAFEKSAEKEYLRDQMNDFLREMHSDGTYDELVAVWFSDDESGKFVDFSGLTGENGSIRYITAATMQPYSYIANGKNEGFEVDIVARFCRKYGYSLTIDSAEFASLIPGITSGMYDIASGTIMITDERAESVNFSDVYYTANAVAVVKNEDISADAEEHGFFARIADSFEKNFIREQRWKLIAEGIGTTCLITVLSALFGSVLAFLICMFRRTGSMLANALSNIYVKLLQGMPIVVLLMILYYIVLGKTGLEAVWVAVIGYSMNFGAYASEIMRAGIESIDGGQREAALALGYSENQAFFKFIFPQAAVRFIPVYRQEIVSLLKSTSIVGYIAIQDLTKMSDIIRSRTYEAFFPLIATAMIYFILAWIITLLLNMILKSTVRRKRKGGAVK